MTNLTKRLSLSVTFAALLCAPQAQAQVSERPFITAGELRGYCTPGGTEFTKCFLYLAAISDVITNGAEPGEYCRPASATYGDLQKIYNKAYSPVVASDSAAPVVMTILLAKYAC